MIEHPRGTDERGSGGPHEPPPGPSETSSLGPPWDVGGECETVDDDQRQIGELGSLMCFASMRDEGLERTLDQQALEILHGQEMQVLRLDPRQPTATEPATESALRIGHFDEKKPPTRQHARSCIDFRRWIERMLEVMAHAHDVVRLPRGSELGSDFRKKAADAVIDPLPTNGVVDALTQIETFETRFGKFLSRDAAEVAMPRSHVEPPAWACDGCHHARAGPVLPPLVAKDCFCELRTEAVVEIAVVERQPFHR